MATVDMATVPTGNTNTVGTTSAKFRAYQLTLNEVDKYNELKNYLTNLKSMDYLISCHEIAPTTGHNHLHSYVHFTNARKLSMKKCQGAHIEGCKGTPQQNINYIRKDGVIIDELGNEPHQGGYNIKDVKNMSNNERLNLPIQYFNIVNKINDIENNEIDNIDDVHKDIKVYYIQGPSGCGKTERAKQIIREYKKLHPEYKINFYLKYENGFYNGATGAKIGVYDDFRDSHMKASEFINLIDYNKHIMNIKGGSVLNNYELLIITSIQPLTELYKNIGVEPSKQWTRRIEVINMFINPYDEIDNI